MVPARRCGEEGTVITQWVELVFGTMQKFGKWIVGMDFMALNSLYT